MTLQTNSVKQIQPIEFLWLGLYAFAGFSMELILSLVVNSLEIDPLTKNINCILTGILWFVVSFLLVVYAKRKFDYDVFAINQKMTLKKTLILLIPVGLITAVTMVGFDGFKPLVEFKNGSQGNILTYLLQIFYYLGESALITLCIAFGQRFGEKQFSLNQYIPIGGLFLAATWGVMHFFLQGIGGGLFTVFFSILAGAMYIICKKDFKWSYLFIAIAFIL